MTDEIRSTELGRDRAVRAAQAVLNTWSPPETGVRWAVIPELTVAHPLGWLVFWDSQRRVRAGDRRIALLSNYPLFVDGNDLTVHSTGIDLDGFLRRYERRRARFDEDSTMARPPMNAA